MKLDRFYPIFDDSSWLERLLPLGVKLVQIRVKDKSINDVREQLIHARELCETYNSTLIINDYWELAIELGCDWVHLGQEDLDEADIGALKKRGVKLGLSTHDQDELDRALTFEPDYIALGPVYPTILKKMKWFQLLDLQGQVKLQFSEF